MNSSSIEKGFTQLCKERETKCSKFLNLGTFVLALLAVGIATAAFVRVQGGRSDAELSHLQWERSSMQEDVNDIDTALEEEVLKEVCCSRFQNMLLTRYTYTHASSEAFPYTTYRNH